VQREDREPLRITPDSERERPTIRRLERPQRLAHESSISRPAKRTRAYELIADQSVEDVEVRREAHGILQR
jgi:hypothetical protein